MSADLIARLIEAGTPAALVAEVAVELGRAKAERDALEARRSSDRARKERQRHVKSRDITGSNVTAREERDSSPDKSPPTPPKNYPSPELPPSPPKGGSSPMKADPPDIDLTDAVAAYNSEAARAGWPQVQVLTARRRTALRSRLIECGWLEGWRSQLARARASPFLCGDNDRGWKADFDFFLQAKSFTKLMEGAYDRSSRPAQSSRGQHELASAFERLADHAQRLEDAHPPPSGWGRQ